jgi:hypothetical protein
LEQQIDVLIYSPDSQGHKRALRRAGSHSHRASVAKTSSFDRPVQGYKGRRATVEPVPSLRGCIEGTFEEHIHHLTNICSDNVEGGDWVCK